MKVGALLRFRVIVRGHFSEAEYRKALAYFDDDALPQGDMQSSSEGWRAAVWVRLDLSVVNPEALRAEAERWLECFTWVLLDRDAVGEVLSTAFDGASFRDLSIRRLSKGAV